MRTSFTAKGHPKRICRRFQREIKIAGNENRGNPTKRQRIHSRSLGRAGDKAVKRRQPRTSSLVSLKSSQSDHCSWEHLNLRPSLDYIRGASCRKVDHIQAALIRDDRCRLHIFFARHVSRVCASRHFEVRGSRLIRSHFHLNLRLLLVRL